MRPNYFTGRRTAPDPPRPCGENNHHREPGEPRFPVAAEGPAAQHPEAGTTVMRMSGSERVSSQNNVGFVSNGGKKARRRNQAKVLVRPGAV
jgi:hypothetical protein